MKFIVRFTSIIVLVMLSANAMAQDTISVKASYRDVTLREVLNHLSHQHNLRFSYSENLVELNKKISVVVEHVSLDGVLKRIFSEANVEYKYIGDQIVIREMSRAATVVVRGKVIDRISGHPLPFASVRIDGSGLGTATNNDGVFVLTVPSTYEKAEMIISYIGYKNHVASLAALGEETVFQLEENSRELQPVVVTAKTGPSILEEAISRINQNYDTSDVQYTYFVRGVSLQDDAPIGASESLYKAYRGSDPVGTPLQQVKFLNGRKIKDFKAVQRILQTFIRWTAFELGVAGNVIFSADLTIEPRDDRFPSQKFMAQHKFELLGVSRLDGRDVYVIDFDQKANVKKSLYKGRFYIDSESLAFSRIEIGLSPRGIEQARFFNTPKAIAALFGYGKCAVTASQSIISWQQLNGKWYPAAIEEYWSAVLVQPKKDFHSNIEVKGNIVVTDIQTESVSPFSNDEILTSTDYRNWKYLYRGESLDHFNSIETDVDIREAFQSIADRNRLQGMDVNFWKRYQPYKSDPSILTRDSLWCRQSEAWPLQQQPKAISSESVIRRPKFPLLDQSFSTRHFVLHYLQQDSSSAREVSSVLEDNYEKVLSEYKLKDLGELVHVEIYPDVEHYHFAIGNFEAPESDVGMAVDLNLFKMISPANPGKYHTKESLLKGSVHEFAHCVHYHFIERLSNEQRSRITNQAEAPWLFEAMASHAAGQFYHPAKFEYVRQKQYPTIQMLNNVEEDGKIYDLGFVIIEFIKYKWGQDGLIALLRTNGNVYNSLNVSEAEFLTQLYQYINNMYSADQK